MELSTFHLKHRNRVKFGRSVAWRQSRPRPHTLYFCLSAAQSVTSYGRNLRSQIIGEWRDKLDYARNMTEWLLLLLLMPAIVAPVALLVGFTGCSASLYDPGAEPPVFDAAVGKNASTITLIWHGGPTSGFEFERTNPDNSTSTFPSPPSPSGPASPYDDTGLAPAQSFKYRVRGVYTDGSRTNWSSSVTGTTPPLSFQTTFQATLDADEDTFAGKTLELWTKVGDGMKG
jgi:hypothetical protein